MEGPQSHSLPVFSGPVLGISQKSLYTHQKLPHQPQPSHISKYPSGGNLQALAMAVHQCGAIWGQALPRMWQTLGLASGSLYCSLGIFSGYSQPEVCLTINLSLLTLLHFLLLPTLFVIF